MAAASESFEDSEGVLAEELAVLESIYISELSVEKDEQGWPYKVSVLLHPATGMDESKKYVCMTVDFHLSRSYPDETPGITVRNPRGLGEEEIRSLVEDMKKLAEERKGGPMLFELIEMAKDCLTEGNIPHCECAICLENFEQGDNFIKTDCYHYFHRACLARFAAAFLSKVLEDDDDQNPLHAAKPKEEKTLGCPMCRLPLSCDLAELLKVPVPKEETVHFVPTSELLKQQQEMAALYEQQKAKGAIIDLEHEKNKFLVDENTVVSLNSVKSDSVGANPSASSVSPVKDHRPSSARQNRGRGGDTHNARNAEHRPHSGRGRSHQHHAGRGEYHGRYNRSDRKDRPDRRDYGDDRRDHVDGVRTQENRKDHLDRRDHQDYKRDQRDDREDRRDERRDQRDGGRTQENRKDHVDRRDHQDYKRDQRDDRSNKSNRQGQRENRREHRDDRKNQNDRQDKREDRIDGRDDRRDQRDTRRDGRDDGRDQRDDRRDQRDDRRDQRDDRKDRRDNGDDEMADNRDDRKDQRGERRDERDRRHDRRDHRYDRKDHADGRDRGDNRQDRTERGDRQEGRRDHKDWRKDHRFDRRDHKGDHRDGRHSQRNTGKDTENAQSHCANSVAHLKDAPEEGTSHKKNSEDRTDITTDERTDDGNRAIGDEKEIRDNGKVLGHNRGSERNDRNDTRTDRPRETEHENDSAETMNHDRHDDTGRKAGRDWKHRDDLPRYQAGHSRGHRDNNWRDFHERGNAGGRSRGGRNAVHWRNANPKDHNANDYGHSEQQRKLSNASDRGNRDCMSQDEKRTSPRNTDMSCANLDESKDNSSKTQGKDVEKVSGHKTSECREREEAQYRGDRKSQDGWKRELRRGQGRSEDHSSKSDGASSPRDTGFHSNPHRRGGRPSAKNYAEQNDTRTSAPVEDWDAECEELRKTSSRAAHRGRGRGRFYGKDRTSEGKDSRPEATQPETKKASVKGEEGDTERQHSRGESRDGASRNDKVFPKVGAPPGFQVSGLPPKASQRDSAKTSESKDRSDFSAKVKPPPGFEFT